MNKTTEALKLAENTLRDIIRVYKFEGGTPVTALAAIREALAEQEKLVPKVSHGLCGGCAKTAADGWALYCVECWEKAEPVKQDPVGEVVLERMGVGDAQIVRFQMYGKIPPVGTKLYPAPISAEAAVLAEREACAEVCDRFAENEAGFVAEDCAAEIRARDEK